MEKGLQVSAQYGQDVTITGGYDVSQSSTTLTVEGKDSALISKMEAYLQNNGWTRNSDGMPDTASKC